jgi:hypothetical protein
MTFNQVLTKLQLIFPMAIVGDTCQPGNGYYDCAFTLDFIICPCGMNDASFNAIEYIARGKNGGIWYIGYFSGKITCGPKGFHKNDASVCV